MCTPLEVMSDGGRGEQRINSLPPKYHTCVCLVERGEKNNGEEEGGRGERWNLM